jgi:DNA-binding SARP family transcriptional activator
MTPTLHIQLLGEFLLRAGDTPVTTVASPRLQSLLAYLVLHHNAPHPRQRLAFLLWPDSSEGQAHTDLRSLLHRLRRALPNADDFLRADRTTLAWRADAPWTLDVADFQRAVAEAEEAWRASDHQAARAALEAALARYCGDLLPGCYDDWLSPERQRLRELFGAALERLIALLEQARDYLAAIEVAQRLLRHDPLREATYRTLMRLHALSSDRAAALRAYHTCAATLERELGAEPGQATRAAYEHLLHLDTAEATPQPPLVAAAPLVGRREEWARLQAAWQIARGRPHMLVLAGEAGIGKTRLAEELLAWADRQGLATAVARCYAAEGGLAYAPVAAWLRAGSLRAALAALDAVWLTDIARLLPELLADRPRLPRPEPLAESWQRQRLFEALARAILAGRQALLLLLDDLQWCDRETLEWLHYLLRFDPKAHLLVVGTVRSEDVPADHPLRSWLAALRRGGQVTEIELGCLDADETAQLAAQVVDRTLDPRLTAQVYAETEGNPLFVVETMRAAVEDWRLEIGDYSAASQSPISNLHSLPPMVQAVVEARLAQLSPAAHELMSLAATIGREFRVGVLVRAAGGDEDALVRGLDELWQRRIVREQGADAYDFSHDKLREVAYAGLSAARRRLLHRRVAQALEESSSGPALEAASGQIADHFERAGMPDRALPYSVRAAEHAARMYAHHQAEARYAHAISIATRLDRPSLELTALYTARGRALELAGRYADAVQVYRDLEALARARGDPAMECAAISQLVMAHLVLTSGVHNVALAEPLIARGLALARAIGDSDQEARLLWGKMFLSNLLGRIEEAYEAGEASIALARRHGLRERLAFALHDFANVLRWNADLARGNAYAEEARALFRERGNLPMLGDNLCQQAWSDSLRLSFESALRHATEAIVISQEIGASSNLGFAMAVRAAIQTARGEWGQAQADAREGVRRGQEVAIPLWPSCLGLIGGVQRMIGQTDRARALHLEMRVASEHVSPFLMQNAEAHLALDAFAAGDAQAGGEWLRLAQTREGPPMMAAMSLGLLASAAVCRAESDGDWEEVMEAVERDLSFARQRQWLLQQPDLLYHQGRCLVGLGLVAEAEASFRQALALAEPAAMRPVLWQVHAALAELYRMQGRAAEAEAERQATAALALEIAGFLDDPVQRTSFLATPAVRAVLRD